MLEVSDCCSKDVHQHIPTTTQHVHDICQYAHASSPPAKRNALSLLVIYLNKTSNLPGDSKKTARVVLVKNEAVLNAAKLEGIDWFEEGAVVENRAALDYARVLNKSVADMKFLERIRRQVFSFDVDKLPQPFPAPTLFITGRQDHWVGYRDAWNIVENYPRGTFVVLDRAGHLVLEAQSELSSAVVNEWLDRVEECISTTHS